MLRVKASLIKDNSVEAANIYSVITPMAEQQCSFCDGFGHSATKCATKKALDRALKSLQLGGTWGRIKSKVLADSYAKMRTSARAGKIAAQKEAVVYLAMHQKAFDDNQKKRNKEAARRAANVSNLNAASQNNPAPTVRTVNGVGLLNPTMVSLYEDQGVANRPTFAPTNPVVTNSQMRMPSFNDTSLFSPPAQVPTVEQLQNPNIATPNYQPGSRGFFDEEVPLSAPPQAREHETPSRALFKNVIYPQTDFKATRDNVRFYNYGETKWAKDRHQERLEELALGVKRKPTVYLKANVSVRSHDAGGSPRSMNNSAKKMEDKRVRPTPSNQAYQNPQANRTTWS